MYNIGRSTSGSSRDICKAPRGPGQGTQVSQKYLFSLVNLNYIADAPKYTFSKALATVTLCSKYTIALTFDIFFPPSRAMMRTKMRQTFAKVLYLVAFIHSFVIGH